MAKILLYVGTSDNDQMSFDFATGTPQWNAVRSQIEGAVNAGRGFFEIPATPGRSKTTYVYSPTLHIRWVEMP